MRVRLTRKRNVLKAVTILSFQSPPEFSATIGTEGAAEHKRRPMSCLFQTLRSNLLCYL